MNIVMLRGNLTRDPILRYTNGSGSKKTAVVNFSVAVSKEITRADGTKDKVATYIDCEAWDSGAEAIAESLKKGSGVMIEGSMRNNNWEKDGQKHYGYVVRVNNFAPLVYRQRETVASDESTHEEVVAF